MIRYGSIYIDCYSQCFCPSVLFLIADCFPCSCKDAWQCTHAALRFYCCQYLFIYVYMCQYIVISVYIQQLPNMIK